MMEKLGILKNEEIRNIWKIEREFSDWLAKRENMELLGNAVGIDILAEETESAVGKYSADILAKEDGSDRKIIIENQYGATNHDHLGKLITYTAGKNAQILIWIVEKADDEHRAAVQWINEHTDADIGIFLIQIEVLRIGDSIPAARFTVLERPNEWTKQNKQVVDSKINQQQMDFWNSFMDYTMKQPEFSKLFNRRKGLPQNWMNLPLGSSEYQICLTVKTTGQIGAEVYINKRKDIFNDLESQKDQIEKELGFKMDWQPLPDKMASRIIIVQDGDYTDNAQWDSCFEWLTDKAVKLKKVFPKYLKKIATE
ncbi:MAG: DUF4268 domain-containing protein [Victivallales bacterium]|nr:DUF4268 domain-containing protein [Victivallales bacterium]